MRRVTMQDVAEEAGVSRALVSIAFRGARGVSDETRSRILEVADRLGYRHNKIAATLASKRDGALGVFLQDLRNDVFADIYDGIRSVIGTKCHIVTAVGQDDGSLDRHAIDSLIGSRVGVVIAAGLTLPDEDILQVAQDIPVISVSRSVPAVGSVYSDDRAGAHSAIEHLAGLGHSRIAFLSNPVSDGYGGRLEGYLQAMAAAGLEPLIVESSYSRAVAAEDATQLIRDLQPTAIFAHNDQAALGVLDALAELGMHSPTDVSVIGYDGSSVGQTPGKSLTTVDVRGREMGIAAAKNAIEWLDGGRGRELDIMLSARLLVRDTTGPPAR